MPATVQDLLEARLDTLEASPRNVAHGAAVIGRTFWTRVLERVTPDESLDPALGTLEHERFISRVLTAEPTYAFVHALVQEVAYRTQLIAQRRRKHVVVGDAYTELFGERLDEFIDTLAFHYRRGDDDPKAVRWLMRAGQRAQRLYANVEALDYFADAVRRSEGDAKSRAEAHEALGDVRRVIGQYDEALASYADALTDVADNVPVDRARLRRKSAIVDQIRGRLDIALAAFERVLDELPDDAAGERARALLNIGEVRWQQGRHGPAIEALERAVAEAARAADQDARAEALKQLGTVRLHQGDTAAALEHQRASLAAYEDLGDLLGQANALNNIGRAERWRSHHDAAISAFRQALQIRQRIGDQLGQAHSHNNIAEIHFLRGELDEAASHYRSLIEISRAIGWAIGTIAARVGIGAVKVEHGEVESGRADLLAALEEIERIGNRAYLVEVLRDVTLAHVAAGSPDALSSAERALAVARELRVPTRQGIALQVLGLARSAAGDAAGAATALEESRVLLADAGERQELARTLAALGRVYRGLPQSDERWPAAEALVREARKIFSELGAELDLRRLATG